MQQVPIGNTLTNALLSPHTQKAYLHSQWMFHDMNENWVLVFMQCWLKITSSASCFVWYPRWSVMHTWAVSLSWRPCTLHHSHQWFHANTHHHLTNSSLPIQRCSMCCVWWWWDIVLKWRRSNAAEEDLTETRIPIPLTKISAPQFSAKLRIFWNCQLNCNCHH